MEEPGGWDMTEFINKYTTKSTMFSSPRGTPTRNNNNAESSLNHSLQSEGVPVDFQLEEEVAFCTKENIQERLNFLNQVRIWNTIYKGLKLLKKVETITELVWASYRYIEVEVFYRFLKIKYITSEV